METSSDSFEKQKAFISSILESSSFDDSLVPLFPSPYKSLILPRPDNIPDLKLYLHTDQIRIAILDSRSKDSRSEDSADPPPTAAMVVPRNRESDWIFSTEAGQIQLLLGVPGISRFILIGNDPSGEECGSRMYMRPEGDYQDFLQKAEDCLYPFLLNFLPKRSIVMENFHITFLRYEDNLVNAVVLERFVGPIVGEMLVEDVEIEDGPDREFRRRLRFKRMPNLVQTEIKIIPNFMDNVSLRDMKFQPDLSALVHVYLAPMAASLSLMSVHLQSCIDSKIRPKALCLGVGGGSLIGFLATQLDFDVVGIEIDQVVLNTARRYFGLEQCEKSVRVFVGDGIEFLKVQKSNYDSEEANSDGSNGDKFDVIMVDLDPGDFSDTSVPPWKFQHERVILAVKCCLSGAGILVLNVIPPTKLDFEILILRLRAVFVELYKIDSGNGENSVVIATMSAIDLSDGIPENAFLTKLKSLKPGEFVDKIEKI